MREIEFVKGLHDREINKYIEKINEEFEKAEAEYRYNNRYNLEE